MPHRARTLSIAFLAASLLASGAAAQTDPEVMAATRRDLLREAQEARTIGDHARALDAAERAGQIGMSLPLRRFIAEEQNAQGLSRPALASAERCLQEAEGDASPARDSHVAACQALAAHLRSRSVGVAPGVPQQAGRPARQPLRAGGAPGSRPGAQGALNPAPVVLVSVGAAAFVAAGVFYLIRGGALSDRDAQCDDSGCPEEARPDHDRAVTFHILTNASLAAGAALAAGGLVWYLLDPRRRPAPTTPEQPPPARRAGLLLAPLAGGAMIGWEGAL